MSFQLIYNELFRFTITHQADQSNTNRTVSKDIRLQPTLATQQILRNARMIFKPTIYGGVVLFRAIDDDFTPLVPVEAGTAFTFFIVPGNKGEFMRVTDLGSGYNSSKVLLFKQKTDSANDNELTMSLTPTPYLIDQPVTPLFNYEFQLSGTPTNVALKVESTELEYSDLTATGSNSFLQQVDMRNASRYPPRKYDLTASYSDGGPQTTAFEVFVDNQLAAAGPIGLVEIVFDPLHYSNMYECEIAFNT